MTTASLAASDRGAAVRIDRLFLGLALGATAILVALSCVGLLAFAAQTSKEIRYVQEWQSLQIDE